ncbi:MAG: hypothetical protein SOR73_05335 [Romboutsia timonensis]|uniref:hypothetical protein n=1 Tax=Romboutsia timonensis TaxID=1776391 RepID=UPI002A750C72|nr:hypothetical protein [Romboutsia timonensis]MDY3001075.1 hypothetical protein [Romboutsia timonensis]
MDIKRIKNKIIINSYRITFEYETRKGYRREQQRIICDLNKENARSNFKEWARDIRTMFNVKILSIVELTEDKKIIEI